MGNTSEEDPKKKVAEGLFDVKFEGGVILNAGFGENGWESFFYAGEAERSRQENFGGGIEFSSKEFGKATVDEIVGDALDAAEGDDPRIPKRGTPYEIVDLQ